MLTTIAALLLVLVLFYLMSSIKIVRQGYQYTIEHFGRYTTTASPGFNFYPAFFYRVGRKVNMMEQVIDIPGQEIITKDNAMIATDGVVFFQVLDAAKAAYEAIYNKAQTGAVSSGLAAPRASVVRRSNGENVVYSHDGAERFRSVVVRTQPLDAERVLIVSGLEPGKRIVTQAAELLNQVR